MDILGWISIWYGHTLLIRVQQFETCFPSPEMKAFASSIKLLKTEALNHRRSSLLCAHRPAATNTAADMDIPIHLSWRPIGSMTLTCWLQASTETSTLLGSQTCLHQHSCFLKEETQEDITRSNKKKQVRCVSQEDLRRRR